MTTGIESRAEDGEMLYCWQIFQEVSCAFLAQIRYQTKMWKYLTLFFFFTSPLFVAAQLTPHLHHHHAVPGIRFPDVVNRFF